jgi:hypothetical protein
MVNSGFVRPQDRVVINLAPARSILPTAVGILAGSGQLYKTSRPPPGSPASQLLVSA